MNRTPHVAVVGATGAVGIEMIKTLERRNFPVGKLTLLASARSAGKRLKFKGTSDGSELHHDSFRYDIVLFSAGGRFEELHPWHEPAVWSSSIPVRSNGRQFLVIPEPMRPTSDKGILAINRIRLPLMALFLCRASR
jgi:aspartate-semialdehyde dehydrogenase